MQSSNYATYGIPGALQEATQNQRAPDQVSDRQGGGDWAHLREQLIRSG